MNHVSARVRSVLLSLFIVIVLAAPAAAATVLSGLSVPGMSPAFDPAIKTYTMPRTTCAVTVTATLVNPTLHRLYIQSNETASGALRQAWVCDGKNFIDVVIYQNWT